MNFIFSTVPFAPVQYIAPPTPFILIPLDNVMSLRVTLFPLILKNVLRDFPSNTAPLPVIVTFDAVIVKGPYSKLNCPGKMYVSLSFKFLMSSYTCVGLYPSTVTFLIIACFPVLYPVKP